MLNSPILDLAITLSFTYFVLGLIVSAINETIQTRKNKRAVLLRQAIDTLFSEACWQSISAEIYRSGHVISLCDDRGLPSYIPAENFAMALIDCLKKGDLNYTEESKSKEPAAIANMNDFRKLLSNPNNQLIGGQARIVLLSLFERAHGDLDIFQKNIEDYYNRAMDRLTGWYKRETSKYIFYLALVIVLLLNVDTLHISTSLWKNQSKLSLVANGISDRTKNMELDKNGQVTIKSGANGIIAQQVITHDVDTTDAAGNKVKVKVQEVKDLTNYIKEAGIPMGWNDNWREEILSTVQITNSGFINTALSILLKLAGLLITAFALLAGSPFWFDMLGKLVNIRGTGKRPDEKPATQSTATSNSQNAAG